MNTFSKTVVATALLGAAGIAQADLTFNIGAASNYLFRGVTQTDDKAAVQGGVDYGFDNGIYLGTWMSNVDFADAEVDLYAGFANEFDVGTGLGYDVSALYYYYPDGGPDANYAEFAVALSYWYLSGGIAYTFWGETSENLPFDSGDVYYNASLDIPLPETLGEGLGVSFFGGYYTFDNDGSNVGPFLEVSDYGHWGIGLSKDAGDWGSVSVTYEQTSGDDDEIPAFEDNAKFWVGWTKEF